MKYRGLILLLSIVFNTVVAQQQKSPNVIIIFADDLGYGDLGCYGAKDYETPNLDKLAENGMKFTDFTVSNSICSPSRAALLTGRYPERWGYEKGVFFPHHQKGMPTSEITIAEILKQEDYKTGIVGKWHLGHQPKFLPTNQGFDEFFGLPYSNDMWQDGDAKLSKDFKLNEGKTLQDFQTFNSSNKTKGPYKKFRSKVPLMQGTKVIEWPVDQSQITRRYTEKSIEFINENKEKPFFLYVAHSMPHIPLYASSKFKGKTKRGLYGDVIEELDWSVGEIIKTLKKNKIEKETLVIFTSDNGPWLVMKKNSGSAGELRGGKMTSYEGGQRVPCIAYWPGTIPKGKVNNKHVSTLDLVPTIASICNADLPKDRVIDGLDISKVLKGKSCRKLKRDYFLYTRGTAIRVGDWKYRKGPISEIPKKKDSIVVQLFNLKKDPNEKVNLALKHPERVTKMAHLLKMEYDKAKLDGGN